MDFCRRECDGEIGISSIIICMIYAKFISTKFAILSDKDVQI